MGMKMGLTTVVGLFVLMLGWGAGQDECQHGGCQECVGAACWFCGEESPVCVEVQSRCPNGSSIIIPPHSGAFCPEPTTPRSISQSSFFFYFFVVVMVVLGVLSCGVGLVFGYYRLAHYVSRREVEYRRTGELAAAHNYERLEAAVARQRLEEAVERGDIVVRRGSRRRQPEEEPEDLVPAGPNPLLQVEEVELREMLELE